MSNYFNEMNKFVSDSGATSRDSLMEGSKDLSSYHNDAMLFKKKRQQNDAFSSIFSVAGMIGLPVSSSLLQSKQRNVEGFMKIWTYTISTIRTICIVVECAYNHLLWPSVALRTCNLVHCLAGYSIMVVFMAYRRRLVTAVMKINYLSSTLLPYGTERRSYTKYLMAVCFLVIAGVAATSIEFFYREWNSFTEKIESMVPFPQDSFFVPLYNWFVIFSFILSYNISTATLYITLFLCVTSYRSGGRLFALYGKKLKMDVSNGSFKLNLASQNIVLFKNIIFSIHEMDNALNACAMIIYIAVINNVFNLLSVVLSNGESILSQVDAFVVLSIVSALIQFFFLTFSGENVRQQNEALKNDLIELSDYVIKQSNDTSSIVMFNLLSENIKSTKAAVTGLGLFTITKRFIPSAVGVTVTYGVLLYQIGATSEA